MTTLFLLLIIYFIKLYLFWGLFYILFYSIYKSIILKINELNMNELLIIFILWPYFARRDFF
jgi:hypothetical protein